MTPTLQSLGIDRLSIEQRLVLVQEIWNTIAAESASPLLSASQHAELLRRAAEDDAGSDDTVAWEQVKSQTLARLHKS